MEVQTSEKKKASYLSRAWGAIKYYPQTSYYVALLYGRLRGLAQPIISTEFEARQVGDSVPVYIGAISSAYNRDKLKELGITHIVTAILGVVPRFPDDFEYLTVPLRDVESENISRHLSSTTEFIQKAVEEGGKVLVHCVCGVSRSATIVAAWMMVNDGYSAEEAITHLQSRRECVDPNPAFREQLRNPEVKR